jgi:hypothetical protein
MEDILISEKTVEDAERQILKEQKTVDYDTREFTIEIIVNKYLQDLNSDNNEIYVPDYQRDFVWSNERQSKFIESIILGLPIPFIFVAENPDKDNRLEIVDGSQRIRTLAAFLNNRLRLTKLDRLTKLEKFYFKDLSLSRQRKFRNTPLKMIVLSDKATEQVRNDMFERINRGSDLLKDMEKRKGIYRGYFNDFIYKVCATKDKFKRLCPIKGEFFKQRQEAEELILRFFAFSENYPTFMPLRMGVAKFLDSYFEKKNRELNQLKESDREQRLKKYENMFEQMLDFVEKYFDYGFAKSENSEYISRVYFEAIAVGCHLALKENPDLTPKNDINRWLKSKEFREIISGKYHTHTPNRIKARVDFVKNNLLGI